MSFDLKNGDYLIPFGLGLRKVFVQGNRMHNIFLVPT